MSSPPERPVTAPGVTVTPHDNDREGGSAAAKLASPRGLSVSSSSSSRRRSAMRPSTDVSDLSDDGDDSDALNASSGSISGSKGGKDKKEKKGKGVKNQWKRLKSSSKNQKAAKDKDDKGEPSTPSASRSLISVDGLARSVVKASLLESLMGNRRASATAGVVAVEVHVIGARGLAAADANGLSDPWVSVVMRNGAQAKTRVRKKTLSPNWEEKLILKIQDEGDGGDCFLRAQVWDWDRFSKDDFLGEVNFATLADVPNDSAPRWYTLVARSEEESKHDEVEVRGEINLAFHHIREGELAAAGRGGVGDDDDNDDLDENTELDLNSGMSDAKGTQALMRKISKVKMDVMRIIYCVEPILQLKFFIKNMLEWNYGPTTLLLGFFLMYAAWHDSLLTVALLLLTWHFGRVFVVEQFTGRAAAFVPPTEFSDGALTRRVKEIKTENRTGRRTGVTEDVLKVLTIIGLVGRILTEIRMIENRPLHQLRLMFVGLVSLTLLSLFVPILTIIYYLASWGIFLGIPVLLFAAPALKRSPELQAALSVNALEGYRQRLGHFVDVRLSKFLKVPVLGAVLARLPKIAELENSKSVSETDSLSARIAHRTDLHRRFWERFDIPPTERLIVEGLTCDVEFSLEWDAFPFAEAGFTTEPPSTGFRQRCVVYLAKQTLNIFVPAGLSTEKTVLSLKLGDISLLERRAEMEKEQAMGNSECIFLTVETSGSAPDPSITLSRFEAGEIGTLFDALFHMWHAHAADVNPPASIQSKDLVRAPVSPALSKFFEVLGSPSSFKKEDRVPVIISTEIEGSKPAKGFCAYDIMLFLAHSGFAVLQAKGHTFETVLKNQIVGLVTLAAHTHPGFINVLAEATDDLQAIAIQDCAGVAVPGFKLLAALAADPSSALRVAALQTRFISSAVGRFKSEVFRNKQAPVESFPAIDLLPHQRPSQLSRKKKPASSAGLSRRASSIAQLKHRPKSEESPHRRPVMNAPTLRERVVWHRKGFTTSIANDTIEGAIGIYRDRIEFAAMRFGRRWRIVMPFNVVSKIQKIGAHGEVFRVFVEGDGIPAQNFRFAVQALEADGSLRSSEPTNIWRAAKTGWREHQRENAETNRIAQEKARSSSWTHRLGRSEPSKDLMETQPVFSLAAPPWFNHNHKNVVPAAQTDIGEAAPKSVQSLQDDLDAITLTDPEWDALMSRAERRTFKKNDVISLAGEVVPLIGQVVCGLARVVLQGSVVSVLGEGAVFGEAGVLPGNAGAHDKESHNCDEADVSDHYHVSTPALATASIVVESDTMIVVAIPMVDILAFFELGGIVARAKFFAFVAQVSARRLLLSICIAQKNSERGALMSRLGSAGNFDDILPPDRPLSTLGSDLTAPSLRRSGKKSILVQSEPAARESISMPSGKRNALPSAYWKVLQTNGQSISRAAGDSIFLAEEEDAHRGLWAVESGLVSILVRRSGKDTDAPTEVASATTGDLIGIEQWLSQYGHRRRFNMFSILAKEATELTVVDNIGLNEQIEWDLSVRFYNYLCGVFMERLRLLILADREAGAGQRRKMVHTSRKHDVERLIGSSVPVDGGFRCTGSARLQALGRKRTREIHGDLNTTPRYAVWVGTVFGHPTTNHVFPFSHLKGVSVKKSKSSKHEADLILSGVQITGSRLSELVKVRVSRGDGGVLQVLDEIKTDKFIYKFKSADEAEKAHLKLKADLKSFRAHGGTDEYSSTAYTDESSDTADLGQGDIDDDDDEMMPAESGYFLTEEDWEQLTGNMETREYEVGQVIFDEGDSIPGLIQVISGQIQLTRSPPEHSHNHTKTSTKSAKGDILSEVVRLDFGPGDRFGEECLLGSPIATGRAVATTPVCVEVLPDVANALKADSFGAKLFRYCATALRRRVESTENTFACK